MTDGGQDPLVTLFIAAVVLFGLGLIMYKLFNRR